MWKHIYRYTVYPKKDAHGFVVLCFVVVMPSFIVNSDEVFIHIHQGCFAGTGAIVRLPQCQWSKPDGYGKISQCITTTKHSKAKTVCIFLWIYCNEMNTESMKVRLFTWYWSDSQSNPSKDNIIVNIHLPSTDLWLIQDISIACIGGCSIPRYRNGNSLPRSECVAKIQDGEGNNRFECLHSNFLSFA